MRTRLWNHVRSHDLDRALASGVSPDCCAALSLRAHTLIGAGARAALARSLTKLVDDAQHPLQPHRLDLPVCRRKIRSSSSTLQELAERLESRDPLDVSGVAKVRLLLSDGRGPLYDRPTAEDLEPALVEALEALQLTV